MWDRAGYSTNEVNSQDRINIKISTKMQNEKVTIWFFRNVIDFDYFITCRIILNNFVNRNNSNEVVKQF